MTPIGVLGGTLRSVVKKSGKGESVSRQPFFSLPLDIAGGGVKSLEDALKAFVTKEELDQGPEKVAHKSVSIETFPEVLCLQLKRFVFTAEGGAQKLSKDVSFPAKLEVDRGTGGTGGGNNKKGAKKNEFGLKAVIAHHGKTAGRGHYTCDVLVPGPIGGKDERRKWMRCDDDKVVSVKEADVLQQPAYVLMYQKI